MGDHRPVRRRPRFGVFIALMGVGVAVIGGAGVWAVNRQDQDKKAAQAQTQSVADPILALCAGNDDAARVLQSAKTPDGRTVCDAAAGVTDNPPPAPAGLTTSEVKSLINAALAKQQQTQPAGPTTAQLTAAVQAFVTANPNLFKAPAPTAAQIQTAVDNYMRAHPPVVSQPQLPQYYMPGLGGFTNDMPIPRRWPTPSPRTPH